MAAPGRRWPGSIQHHAMGGLIMLPLQPPAWMEREAELAEWLEAQGLPEDWQPDPDDLEPWREID